MVGCSDPMRGIGWAVDISIPDATSLQRPRTGCLHIRANTYLRGALGTNSYVCAYSQPTAPSLRLHLIPTAMECFDEATVLHRSTCLRGDLPDTPVTHWVPVAPHPSPMTASPPIAAHEARAQALSVNLMTGLRSWRNWTNRSFIELYRSGRTWRQV